MAHPRLKRLVYALNVPRHLCVIALGDEHPAHVRLTLGACIAVAGVAIMKVHVDIPMLAICIEALGGLVHAFGITPYIEAAIKFAETAAHISTDDEKEV